MFIFDKADTETGYMILNNAEYFNSYNILFITNSKLYRSNEHLSNGYCIKQIPEFKYILSLKYTLIFIFMNIKSTKLFLTSIICLIKLNGFLCKRYINANVYNLNYVLCPKQGPLV